MALIDAILKRVKEQGESDLHITTAPPRSAIDRVVRASASAHRTR